MPIDWPKVLEVFSTGIIGVFVVMILLQIQTQISTRIIDYIESRKDDTDNEAEPKNKNSRR